MTLPLSGVRVLDLTRALAGPFCAMILGDLGADVIKVEPTPEGEMVRQWGPFAKGTSVYYLSVNRNKRSLAVDFRKPEGLALLCELAGRSDVVVENFKPGTADSLGLGYDAVRKANPKLVYASITGFGKDGPYGDRPGFDQIAQGMSGLMSITGDAASAPMRFGIPIGDLVAGMWAALGVVAAVHQRDRDGRGQRVETSLLAGLVSLLCVQGQRYLSLGEVPKPNGNDHPVISPYGTFETKDGPINIAAATEEMWVKLCRILALDDLIANPDFRDNTARMAHRDALKAALNARLRAHTRLEWTESLISAGIPAGPIYGLDDVFADPQVRHSRLVEEVIHPTLGPLSLLASGVRLDAYADSDMIRTPPPLLGADSAAVLGDYGIAPERIAALIEAGVILNREPETA